MTKKTPMTDERARAIEKAAEKNPESDTAISEFDKRAERAIKVKKK